MGLRELVYDKLHTVSSRTWGRKDEITVDSLDNPASVGYKLRARGREREACLVLSILLKTSTDSVSLSSTGTPSVDHVPTAHDAVISPFFSSCSLTRAQTTIYRKG